MKMTDLRRSPRFRQRVQRLILPLSIVTACVATVDSLPAPGKSWRPVLIAQITATWLAVAVTVMVEVRKRRKSAALGAENTQEQPA